MTSDGEPAAVETLPHKQCFHRVFGGERGHPPFPVRHNTSVGRRKRPERLRVVTLFSTTPMSAAEASGWPSRSPCGWIPRASRASSARRVPSASRRSRTTCAPPGSRSCGSIAAPVRTSLPGPLFDYLRDGPRPPCAQVRLERLGHAAREARAGSGRHRARAELGLRAFVDRRAVRSQHDRPRGDRAWSGRLHRRVRGGQAADDRGRGNPFLGACG